MKTAIIFFVSGILIGAGIMIIWRDTRSRRRRAFVIKRDAPPQNDADVEITISYDSKGRRAAQPEKAEQAERFAHGRRRDREALRQILHARQAIAGRQRFVADQRQHLLPEMFGQ